MHQETFWCGSYKKMVTSKYQKLYDGIASEKTILGVGPMSRNCIDATIELANTNKVPILLIGSRRQIESKVLGGGYVWDTRSLARYVKEKDKGEYVFLARDHGGPWQGTNEYNVEYVEAMARCKVSYAEDILSGFDIIHIDPSLKSRPLEWIIKDIKELYDYCESVATIDKRNLVYEAGTEEHSGQITGLGDFQYFVKEVKAHCPKIRFVVGNMGLHVKELSNVGHFMDEQATNFVKTCNEYDVYLKGHNTDYISEELIKKQNSLGIHSVNVAPEFGVAETMCLQNLLPTSEWDRFVEIAHESKKWEKWMIDGTANTERKAIICGHYVFNNPEIQVMMAPHSETLKKAVKESISVYLRNLGWNVKE